MPRMPVTLVDQGIAAASATTVRSTFRIRALFARALSGPLHVVHASETSALNQRMPFTDVLFETVIAEKFEDYRSLQISRRET